jgi:hypothetical protein
MSRHSEEKNQGQENTGTTEGSGAPISTVPTGAIPASPSGDPGKNPPAITPPRRGEEPSESGTNPPSQRDTEDNESHQGGEKREDPPVDSENKDPPPPPPPVKDGKKRIKCESLKGGKITVGNGAIVQIDENGFFEVEEKEANRLLTIPGYEEA